MAVARRGLVGRERLFKFKKQTNKKPQLLLSGKLTGQRGAVYRKQKFVNLGCCNRKSMLGKQVELPAASQITSAGP